MKEKFALFCDSSTPWLILFLLKENNESWQEVDQRKIYIPQDRDDWLYIEVKNFVKNQNEIHVLALGEGPGSFTGLRVSFSFFRIWALLKDLPIVLVKSLSFWERILVEKSQTPLLIRANRNIFFGKKEPKSTLESKPLPTWHQELNSALVFAEAWRGNKSFPIFWENFPKFQEVTLNDKKIHPPNLPAYEEILKNRERYHWKNALPFYGLPLNFQENPKRIL